MGQNTKSLGKDSPTTEERKPCKKLHELPELLAYKTRFNAFYTHKIRQNLSFLVMIMIRRNQYKVQLGYDTRGVRRSSYMRVFTVHL